MRMDPSNYEELLFYARRRMEALAFGMPRLSTTRIVDSQGIGDGMHMNHPKARWTWWSCAHWRLVTRTHGIGWCEVRCGWVTGDSDFEPFWAKQKQILRYHPHAEESAWGPVRSEWEADWKLRRNRTNTVTYPIAGYRDLESKSCHFPPRMAAAHPEEADAL